MGDNVSLLTSCVCVFCVLDDCSRNEAWRCWKFCVMSGWVEDGPIKKHHKAPSPSGTLGIVLRQTLDSNSWRFSTVRIYFTCALELYSCGEYYFETWIELNRVGQLFVFFVPSFTYAWKPDNFFFFSLSPTPSKLFGLHPSPRVCAPRFWLGDMI